MKKFLLYFFLIFSIAFTSCNVEKRVYRKGIYVEHKEQNKKIEKNRTENSASTAHSHTASIPTQSDSTSRDEHTALEDSIRRTIPIEDTVVVDTKGKNHRTHSHEISIGKNEKTSVSKTEHEKNSKKSNHKSHYTKKQAPHKNKNHRPRAHGKPTQSKFHIPFLGWLVNACSWVSLLLLLIYCYAAKYLPLQSAVEWYFLFFLILLSAAFALLALLLIPLARRFDSEHESLIKEGIKNLKIVSIPLLILLLLTGFIVALTFL